MVLVDTSVWVDHFRAGVPRLSALLHGTKVTCHPFVIGELACGNLPDRERILTLLRALPEVPAIKNDRVLEFLDRHRLFGLGVGLIDVSLLAACEEAQLPIWSRDARLSRCASRLGLRFQ
ncbi:MAG: VapC toxin family PIN domain ribonuclease [Proteobacteria bacterium]|nr:VapC toxin family PIN domain ribonuclease [Pseudomonadota bacterium]MDA0981494.1 VapC toxin family PIN domain ribonuclease [Pseudomonadota bacterium]